MVITPRGGQPQRSPTKRQLNSETDSSLAPLPTPPALPKAPGMQALCWVLGKWKSGAVRPPGSPKGARLKPEAEGHPGGVSRRHSRRGQGEPLGGGGR